MLLLRPLLLAFGPFVLVAVSYWIAYKDLPSAAAALASAGSAAGYITPEVPTDDQAATRADSLNALPDAWQPIAERWRQGLPETYEIVAVPPFLLATDLRTEQQRALRYDVIAPVVRALQRMYKLRSPREPIYLVVCREASDFRQLARAWKTKLASGYHGFYLRDRKLVALHWEAGSGALAHELTHALTHADCPVLPEWFDEGFAALYEEAEFDQPGRPLAGLDNWRISRAFQGLREDRLPRLVDLSEPGAFGEGDLELNYAAARAWTLFLQEQQLLPRYYHALRKAAGTDATGLRSLAGLFPDLRGTELEQRFRAWLSLRRPRITTNL